MDYLAIAEGTHIHFNRTEADITSAYGVYRHAHPRAEIFKWYEHLAQENGLSTNLQKSYKDVNKVIAADKKLQDMEELLAWDFYEKNYMNKTINDLISEKIEKTFFSLAVNGGMQRGYKALQYALGKLHSPLVIDGKFGHYSMTALIGYLASDSYNEEKLNTEMLAYMRDFYAYLIDVNPKKYSMYKNGWENRLQALV